MTTISNEIKSHWDVDKKCQKSRNWNNKNKCAVQGVATTVTETSESHICFHCRHFKTFQDISKHFKTFQDIASFKFHWHNEISSRPNFVWKKNVQSLLTLICVNNNINIVYYFNVKIHSMSCFQNTFNNFERDLFQVSLIFFAWVSCLMA